MRNLDALIAAVKTNPADRATRNAAADAAEEAGRVELATQLRAAPKAAKPTRTIKITETTNTGLPNSYGYARKCMRVVECMSHQNGYRSERDVRIIWESEHYSAKSKGPKSTYRRLLREAEARRAMALMMVQGVV